MHVFQKPFLKTSERNYSWQSKLNLKKLGKKIFPGHVIDHALCCSKIATNDAHHLLNV